MSTILRLTEKKESLSFNLIPLHIQKQHCGATAITLEGITLKSFLGSITIRVFTLASLRLSSSINLSAPGSSLSGRLPCVIMPKWKNSSSLLITVQQQAATSCQANDRYPFTLKDTSEMPQQLHYSCVYYLKK